MDKSSQTQDFELLTEIAIAYYCDEVTQEEIANRFGFSRIKIGRLLKRAKEEGIVEINVRYHPVFSTQLEKQMQERFPISRALIALDHNDEDEQRRQVAQYSGNGAADFHNYPQPVQRRTSCPERRFSAVNYAFRLYFSDRQYACGYPCGDVHYSCTLFRQYPAKPVPRREYSSGAGGERAVFDRFGGDVYRSDVAENQTSAGLGRRACFIAYGR